MIEVKDTGIKSYHPDMDGDPLYVTKGNCHYSHEGTKDFLDYITAYQPEDGGVTFLVNTFRGAKAQVRIRFVSPTAFRFQMFPHLVQPKLNEVFGFAPVSGVQVTEESLFIVVKTERVTLRLRKCPWEMTVELDGELLTMEQIKDHNVDQKYKAVPVGFTVGDDGRMLLLMIGMVILLLSVSAVRKNLLEPIQNLTGILSKYSKNTTSYKDVNGAVINALDDTYDVLSQLSDQMEALSVRLYEAELEKRQLNINFRNLQIRPHFLVNNLTTIYDMAQLGQTDKIMNLTVALSNYYRYVLRDCMDMVPLWQELRHMDSIIRINQEWNGNSVHVEYSIAEDVRSILIPVLLVSTFLENSLKHAANSEHGLNITVFGACRQEGEKPFLFLRLRDDGGGYPQELLDYLQSGKLIPEVDGKHIGINNAIQRIRLIYGDAAKITLSNHSDGAQVEIWIPM